MESTTQFSPVCWLGDSKAYAFPPNPQPIFMLLLLPELPCQPLPQFSSSSLLLIVSSETCSKAYTLSGPSSGQGQQDLELSHLLHVVPAQFWDTTTAVLTAPRYHLSQPYWLAPSTIPTSFLYPICFLAHQEPSQILLLLSCSHCHCFKWDHDSLSHRSECLTS